jgi:hypothetical protein
MNADFGRNCRIRPVQSFAGRYTRHERTGKTLPPGSWFAVRRAAPCVTGTKRRRFPLVAGRNGIGARDQSADRRTRCRWPGIGATPPACGPGPGTVEAWSADRGAALPAGPRFARTVWGGARTANSRCNSIGGGAGTAQRRRCFRLRRGGSSVVPCRGRLRFSNGRSSRSRCGAPIGPGEKAASQITGMTTLSVTVPMVKFNCMLTLLTVPVRMSTA